MALLTLVTRPSHSPSIMMVQLDQIRPSHSADSPRDRTTSSHSSHVSGPMHTGQQNIDFTANGETSSIKISQDHPELEPIKENWTLLTQRHVYTASDDGTLKSVHRC